MKLPLLDVLTEKMRWHETRQRILAENVANADTPGYKRRDLQPFTIDPLAPARPEALATVRTSPMHIAASGTVDPAGWGAKKVNGFEVTPAGNGVNLEDEMMQVAGNQMDYQTLTALYTRSVRLIKTALGKSA